jgi:Holliday junction resolvase-like predicted endonuclease
MLAPDPRFEQIDAMEGREFEAQVAGLLELLGYEDVAQTSYYDKGADILASKDGLRVAVQVKRWSHPIDQKSVMQLVNGVKQYECDRGLLVTNSYLTEPAVRTANTWQIEVWDRETLAEYAEGEPPHIDTSICAHCGRSVSPGTTKWCLSRPGRYGGLVYCQAHQKRASRTAS